MKKRSKRQAGFPPRHNQNAVLKRFQTKKSKNILHTTISAKAFVCWARVLLQDIWLFEYLYALIIGISCLFDYLQFVCLDEMTNVQLPTCAKASFCSAGQIQTRRHEHKDTKTQRHKDLKTQRHKDTKTQRHIDTNTRHTHKDTMTTCAKASVCPAGQDNSTPSSPV